MESPILIDVWTVEPEQQDELVRAISAHVQRLVVGRPGFVSSRALPERQRRHGASEGAHAKLAGSPGADRRSGGPGGASRAAQSCLEPHASVPTRPELRRTAAPTEGPASPGWGLTAMWGDVPMVARGRSPRVCAEISQVGCRCMAPATKARISSAAARSSSPCSPTRDFQVEIAAGVPCGGTTPSMCKTSPVTKGAASR